MPYKIVQTLERGKKALVIVPSLWEEKGNLWWPPKKAQYKLMKNDQSKPSKEWKLLKCTLKRDNISTYQLADNELSAMEENSDTDDVQDNSRVVQQREWVEPEPLVENNYEVLANNLACNQEQQDVLQIINAEPINIDQILANQKILSDKMDNMLQMQGLAFDNQRKITQELASQSVQLQEISLQLAELKGRPSVSMLKEANAVDSESFSFKAIENQKDLISLDQILADKDQKKKLRQQLSFLCSFSQGGGITCAYKLLDILFTRDFLCFCSWSGGSRGDASKIGLKNYKNVLNFFCTMVQTWDPTYTFQDNEKFFKTVTKNSMQRKSMKNLRMSSKRNRLNKKQKTENEKSTSNTVIENEKETVMVEIYEPNIDAKEHEEQNMQEQETENLIPFNYSTAENDSEGLC